MQQWNYIKEIGNKGTHQWVLNGDLNITMATHERSSFTFPTITSIPKIKNTIDGVDLTDIGFVGCQYTWSNKKSPPNLIQARLDRSLVNGYWLNHYGNSKVFHIDFIGSDRIPILLVTDPNSNQGKRPCRYYKYWFRDPASHEVIRKAYDLEFRGSPSYQFTNKFRNIKFGLKRYNTDHFGNIDNRVKELESE